MMSSIDFCPTLQSMLQERGAVGRSGKTIDLSSMSSLNNIVTLRNLHLHLKANHTLEVGMRMGGSALTFAQTHKDIGVNGRHVAIDPFQRSPFNDSSGLLALERASLMPYVDFHEDFSCRVLPRLLDQNMSFTMIYIDGSHTFEDAFIDLYYSTLLLETNGLLLFDVGADKHVEKVVQFAKRNMRNCLASFHLNMFHPSGNSISYRLASMFSRAQLVAFKKIGDLERPYGYRLQRF